MNREHKLALIVGFSLVLVVGILISDHFSHARTAKMGGAELQPETARGFPGDGARPASNSNTELANWNGPGPHEQLKSDVEPIVIPAPKDGTRAAGDKPTPPVFVMGPNGQEKNGSSGWVPNRLKPGQDEPRTSPDPIDPLGPGSGQPESTGSLKRHEVKDGDSMAKIAAKHYGTSSVWQKLAEYNKGRVGDNGSIRAGVTLLIPPRDVLDGKATLKAPRTRTNPGTPPGEQTGGGRPARSEPGVTPLPLGKKPTEPADSRKKAPADSKYRTYVVQSGDHLSKIAQKMLGSTSRVNDILALNEGIIRDENNMPVGLTLKLPAK